MVARVSGPWVSGGREPTPTPLWPLWSPGRGLHYGRISPSLTSQGTAEAQGPQGLSAGEGRTQGLGRAQAHCRQMQTLAGGVRRPPLPLVPRMSSGQLAVRQALGVVCSSLPSMTWIIPILLTRGSERLMDPSTLTQPAAEMSCGRRAATTEACAHPA